MGYAVKFTGSNMDQILEKSKSFKSHNEDWVIIPSSIKTLNINSLFRTGNYAYSGTISLPDMEQLYGFNTATAQSATTIDCDCIIFVRNINHNIYQFICMHGIHDADDKIMGIVWIHNTPKVFYVNEISNTLMAIAEDESSDKGLLKFDNQIRFFNVTKNLKYYDETDHTYKVLTGVIDNMDKSIYGDISDVFTMVDNNIDIDINALNDHMNDETIHVTAEEKADYDNKYTSTDLNSDVDAFMKSNSWDNFNTGIDTINANILSIIDTNKNASKELNTHTPGWNLITSEAIIWYSVCYGNDKFVAVGFNPNNSDGKIQYSTDGIVWIDCTPVDNLFPLTSVYYGNGKFIATSQMQSTSYIIESTDGINWEPIQISETSNEYQAI